MTSSRVPSGEVHRRSPVGSFLALAAFATGSIGGCAAEVGTEGDAKVAATEQAIHNEPGCAIRNLTPWGAWLAAFGASGYGNWCGGDVWGQKGAPVNCWDDACRAHDYSFHGPRPDISGMVSCHEVLNESVGNTWFQPNVVPDTTCIEAADARLCGSWTTCTQQAREARQSWRWAGGGSGRGRYRVCRDPAAGVNGEPIQCHWLEHAWPGADEVWTCGACPSQAPPPPDEPPNPACAVPDMSQEDQVNECCDDYATDVRAKSCTCPAEKPLRRESSSSPPNGLTRYEVMCIACPSDKPVWNGSSGPCVEAYSAGDEPSGAIECCERCTPPPPGIVAWWPGDGNANDIVGGHGGAPTGGATFADRVHPVTGIAVGTAFSFDGAASSIEVPDHSALDFTSGAADSAFTFETWIKRSALNRNDTILSKYNSFARPSRQQYIFEVISDNRLFIGLFDPLVSGAWRDFRLAVASVGTIDAGWHHVAATYDGSGDVAGLRLYIDGQAQLTSVESNDAGYVAMDNGSEPVRIGATITNLDGSLQEVFAGLIDEVTIYNRAMTASEVQAVFAAGSAGKCK